MYVMLTERSFIKAFGRLYPHLNISSYDNPSDEDIAKIANIKPDFPDSRSIWIATKEQAVARGADFTELSSQQKAHIKEVDDNLSKLNAISMNVLAQVKEAKELANDINAPFWIDDGLRYEPNREEWVHSFD